MSFLNSNNAEYLSARITNRGRKAIANGNFNIQYFQIGDSEYDYNLSSLTGSTNHQKVFAPFDYDGGVKYPFGYDSTISTTYGTPISNNNPPVKLRNVMGAAGFVSKFSTTPTVKTTTQPVAFSKISGTTSLVVPTGTTFNECEYITLSFESLSSTTITGKTNSLIYKVLSISGNTLTLDRNVPNLSQISGLTGNAQVVCNNFSNETSTGNLIYPIDYTQQLNSWRLNTVWTDKPIGADNNGIDENLNGYTGNRYASVKNLLGYTKTGQTFTNLTGGTITGTSFGNSFSSGSTHELIEVSPSEQRCIAILHYSELGDISVDPERFFKYDDYISYCTTTGINACDISIVQNEDGDEISDTEYFEVYIPFIYYHRNTGNTLGALFTMDETDYYIKSSINSRHQIKFRYLIDEQDYKVGKVFVNNKIIVFDDQELVATLDYRSNRRYTLPSPKLGLASHDGLDTQSMLSTTGQTAWVTYMFENTSGNTFNSLPCNYFNKILSTGTPSQITMKFSGNSFSNMDISLTGITDNFVADKFYALVQTGATPSPSTWKKIDLTSQITGYTSGYINPTGLTGVSFTINYTSFNSAATFDLEDHMSGVTTNYLNDTELSGSTLPQFGDEQPFPGSVRLVRATDIEEMNMLINLPSTQFTTSQNPTYVSGDKMITEVALLDSNKEPLVVAKTPTPVKRTGTQVFAVRLDF
jgi:hypothetical protein